MTLDSSAYNNFSRTGPLTLSGPQHVEKLEVVVPLKSLPTPGLGDSLKWRAIDRLEAGQSQAETAFLWTTIVDELHEENFRRMDCPSRSSDLSPIEHVWDGIGRDISQRSPLSRLPQKLKVIFWEEWALLPQQFIDILINSMKTRCETCIPVRCGHIPY
ncbi:uncharacterized protein TNCV_279311 [Trichonephila clavipes]|nr:uncharacterized protein TNCV_279311 [Trichonephila clavipes]